MHAIHGLTWPMTLECNKGKAATSNLYIIKEGVALPLAGKACGVRTMLWEVLLVLPSIYCYTMLVAVGFRYPKVVALEPPK